MKKIVLSLALLFFCKLLIAGTSPFSFANDAKNWEPTAIKIMSEKHIKVIKNLFGRTYIVTDDDRQLTTDCRFPNDLYIVLHNDQLYFKPGLHDNSHNSGLSYTAQAGYMITCATTLKEKNYV